MNNPPERTPPRSVLVWPSQDNAGDVLREKSPSMQSDTLERAPENIKGQEESKVASPSGFNLLINVYLVFKEPYSGVQIEKTPSN